MEFPFIKKMKFIHIIPSMTMCISVKEFSE